MTDRRIALYGGALLMLMICAARAQTIQPPAVVMPEISKGQDDALPADCTIADALDAAWYRHPAMQRAQHLLAAQHGTRVQTGLWPRPDAKLFLLDKPSERETGVTLAQKFELGGKRKARVSEAAAKAFLAETEFAAEWAAVKANVKLAFAQVAFYRQSAKLHAQVAGAASEYAAMSASLYKVGKLSETKLVGARQVEAIAGSALTAANAKSREAAQYALLSIGVPDADPAIRFTADLVTPTVPVDYEKLLELARKGGPQLAVARVEAEVAEAGQALARAARSMDTTIGLTFKDFSRDDDNGGSAVGAQVSFDLPLWNRGQGSVVAGDERAAAAKSNERLAELDAARALSGFLADYKAWEARCEAYTKDVLPLEEKQYRLAENRYKSGTASKLDLIESERRLNIRRLEYLQARFMLNVAGVELERIALSHTPQD